jgi:putative transposase
MIATEIVNKYDTIKVEKLNIANMTASAKGTSENPGSNVKQKSGLNRAMLRIGAAQFREALKKKGNELRSIVEEVDPRLTSQTCSKCGHAERDNRLSQSNFKCLACNFELNADLNAAINICKKESLLPNKRKKKDRSNKTLNKNRKVKKELAAAFSKVADTANESTLQIFGEIKEIGY